MSRNIAEELSLIDATLRGVGLPPLIKDKPKHPLDDRPEVMEVIGPLVRRAVARLLRIFPRPGK